MLDVSDTIAGMSSVASFRADANTEINFQLVKPDSKKISLSTTTDNQGFGEIEIDAYHLKTAGNYLMQASDLNLAKQFRVYAGEASSSKSELNVDKKTVATSTEVVKVIVNLRDKYKNPVAGKKVKVISSRLKDVVKEDSITTNQKGQAVFNVVSTEEGLSYFSAIVLDTNMEISKRAQVVFYEADKLFGIGGDDLSASLSTNLEANQDFGVLDHFEIEFPNSVKINDDTNYLKISAKDSQNRTVKNYVGTIKIAVTGDDNAVIPNDGEYTFQDSDLGEKEFALAMVFTSTGEKTIDVYDFENNQVNFDLSGQKTVMVTPEKEGVESDWQQGAGDITIKAPSNGAELSSSQVQVSGLAAANSNLKIMLDDNKVTETATDLEGFFSVALGNLADGEHELYVIDAVNNSSVSNTVHFSIDSTSPVIENLEIYPASKLYPENSFTITLDSESNLDYANLVLKGVREPLVESTETPGRYESSLFAPKEAGKYGIDIILSDRMGNEETYLNRLEIEVIEKVVNKPGTPEKLIATPSADTIDLSWSAPLKEEEIKHYNVYFALKGEELRLIQQSKQKAILISNLETNKTYDLSVSAVNQEGEEGDLSNTISVSTSPVIETNTHASASDKYNISALASNSKITLNWTELSDASYYQIQFGINSGDYLDNIKTTQTNYILQDLINGLNYFIKVRAYNDAGIQVHEFDELIAQPNGSGYLVVPSEKKIPNYQRDFSKEQVIKGKTGPEHIIIFSLILAAAIYYIRKPQTATASGHKTVRVKKIQF